MRLVITGSRGEGKLRPGAIASKTLQTLAMKGLITPCSSSLHFRRVKVNLSLYLTCHEGVRRRGGIKGKVVPLLN
jgi:hypothetical protein